MFKSDLFLISLAVLFALSASLSAAPLEKGVEIGSQIGAVSGYTESELGHIRVFGQLYMQTPLISHFRFNLGLGFGQICDGSYITWLLPVKLQLLYYPFADMKLDPYLFAGGGGDYYSVDKVYYRRAVFPDKTGIAGFGNAGFGFSYDVKKQWALDFSAAFNQSFTDNFDALVLNDDNDGYVELLAGVKYELGKVNKDLDGDGIFNDMEDKIGTDKNNPDTDGDGLSDGDEYSKHYTNPLKPDTDDDGLGDKEELFTTNTNPLSPDSDDDGLDDYAEINTHYTSPLDEDSDDDKLNDKDEVVKYGTDPNSADSDGDGLKDHAEVRKYKTDPLKADTDGGSVDDYAEIKRDSDPLMAEDDVVEEEKIDIDFEIVYYSSGSYKNLPDSKEALDKALLIMNKFPNIMIEIHGHTDNVGDYYKNMKLARNRSKAVKAWLVERGIKASRMHTQTFGPSDPAATNSTKDGRALNRRVEFIRVR